jgi:hypothetical protein
MADLTAIRQALADILNGVGPPGQGIRASADMATTINPPAAIITLTPGTVLQYQAMNGGEAPAGLYTLRVTVLANIGENADADNLLGTYLSTTGSGSLLAAIHANPRLGGLVEWAVVQAVHGYGWVEWGGIPYLGAQLAVQVGVSG